MYPEIGIQCQTEFDKIALKSLSWEGRIEGFLFLCKLSQEYVNTSDKTLEVSYTFPLSWESVVTEFAAVIGGQRLVAEALPKSKAQAKYEKGLEEGDLPLLLECSDITLGLYTANLGSLKPGESVKIEISTAQILTYNRGEVRLNIPTVVAERYSQSGGQGTLLPHEQTHSSIFADYKGHLALNVKGFLATSKVTCLSHPATFNLKTNKPDSHELEVEIQSATPDRDIAFLFSDVEVPPVFALTVIDSRKQQKKVQGIGLLTYIPKITSAPKKSLDLNIVVDCSGSMEGIPMRKAKEALYSLFNQLTPEDKVTFTKFGSSFVHEIPKPLKVTPTSIRRDIAPVLKELDADLGGTELGEALAATFELAGEDHDSDVLLITDGEVWDAEPIIAEARKAHHRIFIIGVSSAPAEAFLGRLAEATGGSYTVTMPSEDMRPVLRKMLERIRSKAVLYEVEDCGKKEEVPLWEGLSASFINQFVGDEADYSQVVPRPVENKEAEHSSAPMKPNNVQDAAFKIPDFFFHDQLLFACLTKLSAMRRCKHAKDVKESEKIAVKNGLLSPYVSFVLVHKRAEADKFKGLPEALLIPQMVSEEDFSSEVVIREAVPLHSKSFSGGDTISFASARVPQTDEEKAIEAKALGKSRSSSRRKPKKAKNVPKPPEILFSRNPTMLENQISTLTSLMDNAEKLSHPISRGSLTSLDISQSLMKLLTKKARDEFDEFDRILLLILLVDVYLRSVGYSSVLTKTTRNELVKLLPVKITEMVWFDSFYALLDEKMADDQATKEGIDHSNRFSVPPY